MFVPEVLMAAKSMHAGLNVLRPELVASGAQLIGTIVMGTVKGDLHDIGKNLVGMLCEGAGFDVIDLGFNVGEIHRGYQGAPTEYRGHVGPADDDHASHGAHHQGD
jgi:cobalamin-dependent methionine synthase I